jgi:hypothetical protein
MSTILRNPTPARASKDAIEHPKAPNPVIKTREVRIFSRPL